MRRRTMPISWPRRDPRHHRFVPPNAGWEYKLKPVEFVIFSCLCYRSSTSTLTPGLISADVHMTVSTVISKRLGHAQVSTTANIYAHVMEAADKKNADILADVLLKNG